MLLRKVRFRIYNVVYNVTIFRLSLQCKEGLLNNLNNAKKNPKLPPKHTRSFIENVNSSDY